MAKIWKVCTKNSTGNDPYRFPCLTVGIRPKPCVRFVHAAKRTMNQMPLFGGVSFSRQPFAWYGVFAPYGFSGGGGGEDVQTVVWQTLQVQRKAWKSKKVRQSSLVLFINHSAPILVRSHQNIKVGWSKDWEWALEKGRFGPHFSRVKADYFQSSSHFKAFFKKTSSLDHL